MSDEDVKLARAWLRGEGGLMDDLADLVESMMDKRLDPAARTFISTIGNAAKSKARQTPAGAPARPPAPPPEPSPAAPVDINELWRRRQERNREQRMAFLGQRNAAAWGDVAEMAHRAGWGE
jgi:hypothetical protein